MKVSRARRVPGTDYYSVSDSTGDRRLYRGTSYLGSVEPAGRTGWRLRKQYFTNLRAAAEYLEALVPLVCPDCGRAAHSGWAAPRCVNCGQRTAAAKGPGHDA